MNNEQIIEDLSQKFNLSLEELKNYDKTRNSNQKQFICQLWLRGVCCFPSNFCHYAHGIENLDYSINSVTDLIPLQSQDESQSNEIIKNLPFKYFILYEFQNHPIAQEQLKLYYQFFQKKYNHDNLFSLREIKYQRSIKPIIIISLFLQQISAFYLLILKQLNTEIIPKATFLYEICRVGFSQLGSHFERPQSLLNLLESCGKCYVVTLKTDLVIKGYDQSILRNQQSYRSKKKKQQQAKQNEQQQNEGSDDDEYNIDENQDLLQNNKESQGCVESQEGIKEIEFIIYIKDKRYLIEQFNIKLRQIIEQHPEYKVIKDIDEFDQKIFEILNQQNQINFMKYGVILPRLHQILKIENLIWEEYAEKYQFYNITFYNSKESGMGLEQIKSIFDQQQKLQLKNYLEKPQRKNFLCQYWMSGQCIFRKEHCKYAHGLNELQIKEANQITLQEIKQLDYLQRPLKNLKKVMELRTYKNLFLYQYQMIKEDIIKKEEKLSMYEIDNIKEYREKIRETLFKNMIVKIYQQITNRKPQLLSEIIQIYRNLGFLQRLIDLNEQKIMKILVYSGTVFEKESIIKVHLKQDQQQETLSKKERQKATQKQILLIPVKNYVDYDNYYQNLIFQALENVLQEKVSIPIEESVIKKELYKLEQDVEMPGLYQFFLRHPIKKYTLIDYFQEQILGQVKNKLKNKIHPEVYQEISDDAFNLIQFEADIGSLMILIEAIYGNIIQKNQICLNFNKIINQIEMKASDNDKYNCLVTYLYKEKQHNFISINGNLYSLNQNNQYLIQKIKKCKCGKSYQQPSFIKQFNQNKLLTKIIEYQIFKDKDVRNTIIIDTPEKLLLTQKFFESDVNYVAVDLEGNLRKGDIWLTQLGVQAENQRLIFILDFMKIKYLEADLIFHNQMMNVLKQIIENIEICKVFHDCKRDSQALHQNLICPQNIVDTSCTYQLLEYLKFNNQKDTKKIKNSQQISKEILQISTPPINSVLTKYGALHGGNELKKEMHNKFKQPQGEDFFVRPNPAFMYYSARDVEDLVQVYLEMEKKALNWRYVIEKMSNKNKEFYIKTQ